VIPGRVIESAGTGLSSAGLKSVPVPLREIQGPRQPQVTALTLTSVPVTKTNVPHPSQGTPQPRTFGAALAKVFRTSDFECSLPDSSERPDFAITRVRSGPTDLNNSPEHLVDSAILVWVSLTPASHSQWQGIYNGKTVGVTRPISFATTFVDLNRPMQMSARGPFDYMHLYRLCDPGPNSCGYRPAA
jgi:hypothetical protein